MDFTLGFDGGVVIFGHFWPFSRVKFRLEPSDTQNLVFFAMFCSYVEVLTVKVALKCV